MVVPFVGTVRWIASLNLTVESDWRPWFVDGQVAGYTVQYDKDGVENAFQLTYATVKGKLPFKLETGYVGVGVDEDVQLFYYFIESERNPRKDPLVFWQTGGPGCSGLSGILYEIGPFTFNYQDFDTGSLPTLLLNPFSWTKISSIIFIDAPVGTGFSYSRSQEAYNVTDTIAAAQNYEFLRKWLLEHPKFRSNPLYVFGDSYGGKMTPMVTQHILNGIRHHELPVINIHGFFIGNPITDEEADTNSKVEFAYRVGLLSSELYESVKESCKG
ncbi:hypothetical protein MLD38_010769 [Melastoma candidum]|uniref:Uncharacterized protein n=1 Tax=Melastoma candidum TaxID=119954 RepID=A0ACB9R115_9MYRT|nr:hypothetical protein MLD38_010769 [Melastoma candidum]